MTPRYRVKRRRFGYSGIGRILVKPWPARLPGPDRLAFRNTRARAPAVSNPCPESLINAATRFTRAMEAS